DRLAAVAGVAAPQARGAVEDRLSAECEVVHVPGAGDQPRLLLEAAVGGERQPERFQVVGTGLPVLIELVCFRHQLSPFGPGTAPRAPAPAGDDTSKALRRRQNAVRAPVRAQTCASAATVLFERAAPIIEAPTGKRR